MSKVTAIVVHHAAAPRSTTVETIRGWHKAKGWRDIGYHYLLRQPTDGADCVLSMGRPHDLDGEWESWEYGAHSQGENSHTVGICLIGNFETEEAPAEMWDLLVQQCASLCVTFGLDADAVKGHREMPGAATACPGKHVRLPMLREFVAEAIEAAVR